MGGWLTSWVGVAAVLLLGVTAGAMMAEAALLVPYWQSLQPSEFFDWYASNAGRLVAFYSPIEVASAVVALAVALAHTLQSQRGAGMWWVAAALSVGVIAMFFIYFKDANESFANRTVADDAFAATLATWAQWQWARVALGCMAFLASILAIRDRKPA